MAVMDALLRIKADVQGEGQVQALGRAMGGLSKTAGTVTGGFKSLAGAAGNVVGGMGALVPLLSGAGLLGLAQKSIATGDKLFDMSQKTGVAVEQLSRFSKAANISGTNIDGVSGAILKLSRNMTASMTQAANAAGESAGEIKERTKRETDAAVDAVKRNADRQVDAIKEGERKQLDAVKENGDKRLAAIERESDARLSELNRRYRQEEKLLNDKYEDEADKQEEAAEKEQKKLERQTEKRYDIRIEAIQEDDKLDKQYKKQLIANLEEQRDAELELIRDRFDKAAKLRQRALRDEEEAARDQLEQRKKREEAQLKGVYEGQKEIVEKGVEEQRRAIEKSANLSAEAVKAAADRTIEAMKAAADPTGGLSEQLEELGLSGKGASAAFTQLGINIRDSKGNLRSVDQVMLDIADRFQDMPDGADKSAIAMKLFGKAGAEMIPMLNMGREEIMKFKGMSAEFAAQADKTSDSLVQMQAKIGSFGGKIATVLMPAMEAVTSGMTVFLGLFEKLPGPIQTVIGLIAIFSIAMRALAPAILAVGTLLGGISAWFAGLTIMATIAGWAPALIAPFAGLLTWLTATFLPGLLFIFGPAGLVFLAIAALVALIVGVKFREPIMKFLGWVGETVVNAMKLLLQGAYTVLAKPWVDLFNVVMRAPITGMIDWLKATWTNAITFISNALRAVARAAEAPFRAVIDIVRSLFNSVLGFIARGVNGAIGAINLLISGYNRLPTPDIPLIPQVSVPQFAEGGVVDRPTLAMVGEGGEREYIIPESKMAGAATAYLAGTRGAGVITGAAGPAVINITTGPVLQQDGQQWVTTRDLERAMRATEAGTLARIRTPAGRSALGIR
jgi:hypothetical protein